MTATAEIPKKLPNHDQKILKTQTSPTLRPLPRILSRYVFAKSQLTLTLFVLVYIFFFVSVINLSLSITG